MPVIASAKRVAGKTGESAEAARIPKKRDRERVAPDVSVYRETQRSLVERDQH